MTDYTISFKLSNETVYACYRGRFWRWDGSFWKESHLMTQKFERAKAADKHLTPQAFLSAGDAPTPCHTETFNGTKVLKLSPWRLGAMSVG